MKGVGNEIDYGMRVYDPRAGRFLSVDPLQKRFAYWTPYQFSANSPILFIDLDGLEPASNFYQWKHTYEWAKNDYHDDDFENYYTINEKDKQNQPYLVRTRIIGSYPYQHSQFQYYDRAQKDYFYFNPTGFEPEYVQNLGDLKAIGEFGKALEKASVVAALGWSPIGRDLLQLIDFKTSIDRRGITSTKERTEEIKREANTSDYIKNNVLTIAVADAQDSKGNTYRLVSINSKAQQDSRIYSAVQQTLKPNEILVPNILGGDAHAEENLNEFARRYGLTTKTIDVSRPFCPSCSEARRKEGSSTETKTSPKAKVRQAPAEKVKR